MTPFNLMRLGTIMTPESGNPLEAEGVLNPAAMRGADGHLYLFPRMVAKGNYSRIGIARVLFNGDGDPVGVERLGIALEPETDYELGLGDVGGCEDPRITYVTAIESYLMTYVALSPVGPRVALAISSDLFVWERIGLANFTPYHGIDFEDIDDKDAMLFPLLIEDPSGQSKVAILHRPHFRGAGLGELDEVSQDHAADLDRRSIWISFGGIDTQSVGEVLPGTFSFHRPLASPVSPWEKIKIGGGTPPILTPRGWLIVYHGVSKVAKHNGVGIELCYSAGLMLLAKDDPREILYRSPDPILTLSETQENTGDKGNVVFPTGIDRRDDLGHPDRFDIYYGMGDTRIGVASFRLPAVLPAGALIVS
jgi:predicted GH43/DUF377 family glycosyl hydrolase